MDDLPAGRGRSRGEPTEAGAFRAADDAVNPAVDQGARQCIELLGRAAALPGRGPAGRELREIAAVHAAVEALRAAVDQLDAEPAGTPPRRRGTRRSARINRGAINGCRERGQLHREHGRGVRRRGGCGDDRGRPERHLRVQAPPIAILHPPHPTFARSRTGLGKAAGGSGSARFYRRRPGVDDSAFSEGTCHRGATESAGFAGV